MVFNLNKANIHINIGITILTCAVGILFLIIPSNFVSSFVRSEFSIKIVGCGIVVMSIFLIVGYINLISKTYGLILSDEGLTNNTNMTNVGLIEWGEIMDIKVKHLKKNTLILIYVRNKGEILSKVKNPFIRLNHSVYSSFYGTPFVIETKNIICSLDDLKQSIIERHERHK